MPEIFLKKYKWVTNGKCDLIGFGFVKFKKSFFNKLGFKTSKQYTWYEFDNIVCEASYKKKIKFKIIGNVNLEHLHWR